MLHADSCQQMTCLEVRLSLMLRVDELPMLILTVFVLPCPTFLSCEEWLPVPWTPKGKVNATLNVDRTINVPVLCCAVLCCAVGGMLIIIIAILIGRQDSGHKKGGVAATALVLHGCCSCGGCCGCGCGRCVD
jgi:hypothetical protein